ncbi:MAG TPA: hypothetical protein PKK95_11975 [Vicinamibacterales bacterium]|nr:hypothetical protein [Vicinamibacterales bacterium]
MTAGRALGLATILALAATWLASSYLANRPTPLPLDEPLPISQTEVGRATARLALGLKSLAAPSRHAAYKAPVRNPFRFGATSGPPNQPGPSARRTSSETLARGASDLPPERPSMRLSGMAEDPGPRGPVRRAVIVAADQLFVVGTGDLVLARFRVTRIDAEAVELEDLLGGPRTVLALR